MPKHSEIVDLLLKDNKLILDPSLVNKLKAEPGDRIEIVNAPEVISCNESPTMAIRRKTGSSLVAALNLDTQRQPDKPFSLKIRFP